MVVNALYGIMETNGTLDIQEKQKFVIFHFYRCYISSRAGSQFYYSVSLSLLFVTVGGILLLLSTLCNEAL